MNQRIISAALLAVAFSITSFGCGNDDDESGLVALSAVIPDPVPVALHGNSGSLSFDFSGRPLDVDQAQDMLDVLRSGGIAVVVTNTETGVNYNLTSGTLVEAQPGAPGEFSVNSDDGTQVVVTFHNSFDGKSIQAGSDYQAMITVIENGYFIPESFSRSVAVSD